MVIDGAVGVDSAPALGPALSAGGGTEAEVAAPGIAGGATAAAARRGVTVLLRAGNAAAVGMTG